MLHSDLGLHCLPITPLGVSSLQWVREKKKDFFFSLFIDTDSESILLLILQNFIFWLRCKVNVVLTLKVPSKIAADNILFLFIIIIFQKK